MYKKYIFTFMFMISYLTPSLAKSEDAYLIDKNEPAKYSGILMPTEALQSLRKDLLTTQLDLASSTRSIELYKQNEELYDKKITVLSDQNNNLADRLYSAQSLSTWERIGYFSLGVLVTGAIGYGTYKAALSSR